MEPTILVAQSPEHLADAAARFCASVISETVNRRGRCSILLSGGSTPQALYEALSRVPYADNLPWAQCVVAWGDERLVPPDDVRSNQRMVLRALLNAVPIPPEHLLMIDTTLPPDEAARAYEARLQDFFHLKPGEMPVFDLCLLGIGSDGHTASLFPGMDALHEAHRLVVSTPAPDPAEPARITVTLPVLNHASTIVFLAQGEGKADIVRRVLRDDSTGQETGQLPARLVRPTRPGARLVWLLDEEAAQTLRSDQLSATMA